MGLGHLELRVVNDSIIPYFHSKIHVNKEIRVTTWSYGLDYPKELLFTDCSHILADKLGYHRVTKWEPI